MPELPEVHTTVEGLKKTVVGLTISDVWTNYRSNYAPYKNQIKNPKYFQNFKKEIVGKKIIDAERRHKNILVHLDNDQTILIHMKMTGHLLFGKYQKVNPKSKTRNPKQIQKKNEKKSKNNRWKNEIWIPHEKESEHLWDPFNSHIRFVFTFSNGKHLVLSDMRKFAKIQIIKTKKLAEHPELKELGPEPLERSFTYKKFINQLNQKSGAPIKSVLMDQTVISGIGNIYSDEILFEAGVHPESISKKIPTQKLKEIFKHLKPTLRKGIKFGGDSTSDYRDVYGKRGNFQKKHSVYRKTNELCPKKDGGIITRKVVRGRSAHFCPKHQKLYR